MNIYLYPLVTPESFFFLIGVIVMTVVGVAGYNPERLSIFSWGTPIPPRATITIGVVLAALFVGIQIDEARFHFRAERRECEAVTGQIGIRVFNDRGRRSVLLSVAGHDFSGIGDSSRILRAIEAAGRSRVYSVCADGEGRILRIDRVPR